MLIYKLRINCIKYISEVTQCSFKMQLEHKHRSSTVKCIASVGISVANMVRITVRYWQTSKCGHNIDQPACNSVTFFALVYTFNRSNIWSTINLTTWALHAVAIHWHRECVCTREKPIYVCVCAASYVHHAVTWSCVELHVQRQAVTSRQSVWRHQPATTQCARPFHSLYIHVAWRPCGTNRLRGQFHKDFESI
jgi:hypothetical protein